MNIQDNRRFIDFFSQYQYSIFNPSNRGAAIPAGHFSREKNKLIS